MPRDDNRQAREAVVTAPARSQADTALVLVNKEIDNRMAILTASAAAGIDPERFRYVALTVLTRNPRLLQCTPVSIARAIVEAAQLGLEVGAGALPGAYLVPYYNRDLRQEEAQLIPSYKGLIDLARRSGQIAKVEARAVHEKDRFEYWYGLAPNLVHVPYTGGDPGPLVYVYAIAFFREGAPQFDVMSRAEVEVNRTRSRAADQGPWVTDYEAMCLKTVLRRLCKLLPLTKDAIQALEREDQAEAGAAVVEAPPAAGKAAALRAELQRQLLGEGTTSLEGLAADGGTVIPAGVGPELQRQPDAPGQPDATPPAPGATTEPTGAPGAAQADQGPPAEQAPAAQAPAAEATCTHRREGQSCVLPAGHPGYHAYMTTSPTGEPELRTSAGTIAGGPAPTNVTTNEPQATVDEVPAPAQRPPAPPAPAQAGGSDEQPDAGPGLFPDGPDPILDPDAARRARARHARQQQEGR